MIFFFRKLINDLWFKCQCKNSQKLMVGHLFHVHTMVSGTRLSIANRNSELCQQNDWKMSVVEKKNIVIPVTRYKSDNNYMSCYDVFSSHKWLTDLLRSHNCLLQGSLFPEKMVPGPDYSSFQVKTLQYIFTFLCIC